MTVEWLLLLLLQAARRRQPTTICGIQSSDAHTAAADSLPVHPVRVRPFTSPLLRPSVGLGIRKEVFFSATERMSMGGREREREREREELNAVGVLLDAKS